MSAALENRGHLICVMSPPLVIEQDDADRVIDALAQGLESL
ncbi:MAG: hypothetical protein QOH74_1658 [Gaiellales bacterium]|nr:hypothetical protein [Gaiellales bacterium]